MKITRLQSLLSDLMYAHMRYSKFPVLSEKARIERLRLEMDEYLTMDLTIDRELIQSIWQDCFDRACDEFRKETGERYPSNEIGWAQVFENEVD